MGSYRVTPGMSAKLPYPSIFALVILLGPLACRGDVFSFTDDNGAVHLSNFSSDIREVKLIDEPASQPKLPEEVAAPEFPHLPFAHLVDQAAKKQDVDSALLHAVIATESAHNPDAVSPKGARGLMQLMPATATRYGVSDPLDPAQNIDGGSRYINDLMHRFNHDLNLVLAAYNAGENAVERYGKSIPPYPETQAYVAKVLHRYQGLVNAKLQDNRVQPGG